ncbi:carboxypeptidase [Bifidobacterium sp. DSM 109958]|uniref:Carboxypeptidase n=1 Tax=Bifidobacterium moraviense TaxID=2675323 RepID=A0A7Y0HYJ9_9BIFI|nr:carboxypeptidase [Bifidobacterium sp. DSM 109958]NMM99843.1 carboxypeptidase [Bifidobacterium sp. DSM 109958]
MSDQQRDRDEATGAATNAGGAETKDAGTGLPRPVSHTTRHAIVLDGRTWTYDVTVGTMTIDTAKVRPAASIFSVAYQVVDEDGEPDRARPVTFIFNGGPGSSTTFLLMGSVAPKRIVVPDAAPVPGAPYELADNMHTLLPTSDLVFIDAAGAGFSQIADKAKPELWSVDGDVKGFSAFIRRWLSANHRWNSPKYVLGESYGTTRGAALAYRLQQDGVALNGLVLISNILDYAFTLDTSDQFYVGYFPTYASVAQYHGRAGAGMSPEEHRARARAFANGPLRLALAMGASLDEGTKHDVARRYAELTGLDAQYVFDSDLRVTDMRFRKQLLRGDEKIVGRYDGRVAGYDLDRMSDEETFVVDDAFLDPAYSSLANAYLRDDLGWDGEEERRGFADFDWSATEPGKGWTWWHTQPEMTKSSWGRQIPFPNVVPDLAAAIAHSHTLKVLVGNGVYDLCTPFFQTEYDIDHLGLPAALRGNVAFTYYPAGHMLYSSERSLAKFAGDLARFYAADAAGLAEIDERPKPEQPNIAL